MSLNPQLHSKPHVAAESAIEEKPGNNSDPLEEAVAKELWRWAFASDELRSEITNCGCMDPSATVTPEQSLASMLEYYLCGVFQLIDYTRSQGVWCDGVAEFAIKKNGRQSFLIVAAAYCPNSLAPVELEFHFPERRSCRATRIVVRYDEPTDGSSTYASKVISKRPTSNQEWAVAVELTPQEGEEHDR